MKVLVCGAGSRGDIHPLLGLADTLRRRGHDVHILLNPIYRDLAESHEFTFVPVGDATEMSRLQEDPRASTYNHGWKQWLVQAAVRSMRPMHQAIVENYEPNNTVLVGNYLAFGARMAHDHLGIPLATVHMDAHTIRSINEVLALPFPGIFGSMVPRWYQHFQFWMIDRFWIDPLIAPAINQFRNELRLPSVRRIAHDWWHSPQVSIGLYPNWWGSPQPDWPSQCVSSDFIFWDDGCHAELSADARQFLSKGPRPIAFTPGTSNMHTTAYFSAAIEACRQLGKRGIIITDRTDLVPALPETMRCFNYVPFGPLLRELSLVVHHGGVGTSAQCIAAGLPQVVVPSLYNQPDTAKRLERLGVARSIAPEKFTARRLITGIQELLDNSSVQSRCAELASKVDRPRGQRLTGDIVESLCGTDVVSRYEAAAQNNLFKPDLDSLATGCSS